MEVEAAKVGIKPGMVIRGWAFTQHAGTVYWDKAGIVTQTPQGEQKSGPPQQRSFIVRTLGHWQKDTDLAGIRDVAALAKLPAEEQKAFTQLWADVAAVWKKDEVANALNLARAHAQRKEWEKASQAYARVIDHPSPDWGHIGFEYAAVLLLAGDREGQRKMCAWLVEKCGQPGVRPYHVARAFTLAPDSFTPAQRPGELAMPELKGAGTTFWSLAPADEPAAWVKVRAWQPLDVGELGNKLHDKQPAWFRSS